MVAAVDQKNKTFTITGKEATRVFKVTEETKILKGAYWKNADGTLEAKMVKLGPAPKSSATPKT